MFLFCFTKILNQAFYLTHTFDSVVSLHFSYSGPRWGSRCDMRNAKCTRVKSKDNKVVKGYYSLQWLYKDIKLASWSCQESPKKDSICYKTHTDEHVDKCKQKHMEWLGFSASQPVGPNLPKDQSLKILQKAAILIFFFFKLGDNH